MDWALYILTICLVGLVTFGLILLLFAEIFKGRGRKTGHAVFRSQKTGYSLTAEERSLLTPASRPKPTLSAFPEVSRRRNSLTEEARGNEDDFQMPQSHSVRQ